MAQQSFLTRKVSRLLQHNDGAVGYISLKKGRIKKNLSSFKYK